MSSRITIKKIAAAAGVSHSTVSRALRNDPRISVRTRNKVKRAADGAGYKADPRISELMRHLRARNSETKNSAIAWINHRNEEDFWRTSRWSNLFLSAARRAAEANGYHLDEIWLGPYAHRTQNSRILQILSARGIRALLIPPFIDRQHPWMLPWEKFCAISIGAFPFDSRMPCVDSDDYHNTLLCCRMLREKGLKRIGLVLFATHFGADNPFSAAILQESFGHNHPACPPLILDQQDAAAEVLFRRWFAENKPDSLVCDAPVKLRGWLEVPSLPIVTLNVGMASDKIRWSGIDQKQAVLCATAVEQLVVRLQNNQHGLPDNVVNILLEGSWKSGETL